MCMGGCGGGKKTTPQQTIKSSSNGGRKTITVVRGGITGFAGYGKPRIRFGKTGN